MDCIGRLGSLRVSAGRSVPAVALALAGLAGWMGSAEGGAWTQAKGHYYGRAAFNLYSAEKQFDAVGEREPLPRDGDFRDGNLAGYFEYGITDRFTGIVGLSLKSIQNEDYLRTTKTRGIGDIDLALRSKLLAGSAGITAIQVTAKLPSGYDTDVELPLGNGESEYEARFLYGRSLWPLLPGYSGVEAGYRWRNGAPTDEFRYLAEVGSDLGKGIYFRTKLDGTRGRKAKTTIDVNGNPTAQPSYNLGKLDFTAGLHLRQGVSVEAGFCPEIYGRTTAAGSAFTLAFAYVNSIGE